MQRYPKRMSGDAYIGARKEYESLTLDESMLDADPIQMLRRWIQEAEASGHPEPNGMCLSTVGPDLQPSSRMLLLRGLDDGLVFYTNYLSRKGSELALNAKACATFWWPELERQVRAEGYVLKTSPEESDAYFASRPYESQVASTASPQSRIIENRGQIEHAIENIKAANSDVLLRPAHWGGYRLLPRRIEFWQGRPARVHDRLEYILGDAGWEVRRLAP